MVHTTNFLGIRGGYCSIIASTKLPIEHENATRVRSFNAKDIDRANLFEGLPYV